MTSNINALELRRRLGRDDWEVPESFGPDGWVFRHKRDKSSVIVTCQSWGPVEWIHASVAHSDRMPTYLELFALHRAVWHGRGWAVQIFAPNDEHISIHNFALHLWGRLDGERPTGIPNFGAAGTI